MKRSTFKTAAVAAGTVALVAALAACAPAAQEPAAAPSGGDVYKRQGGAIRRPRPKGRNKMELTRRTFVKSTAVALASAAAAGTMAGCSSLAGTGGDAATSGGDSVKTVGVCRFCGCGCGVIVEAKDGKVISVTGDPENGSSRGLNCVKGYYLAGALYGEDRLTTPLIRDDKSTQGTPDGRREACLLYTSRCV